MSYFATLCWMLASCISETLEVIDGSVVTVIVAERFYGRQWSRTLSFVAVTLVSTRPNVCAELRRLCHATIVLCVKISGR